MAKVNGAEVHLSDVQEAAAALPPELRNMPGPVLFPMLLDQIIDRKAAVVVAQRDGLARDPAVQRQVQRAEEVVLQNALLTRDISPLITEDAIRARYQRDVASKPGEEEVHARHILVATEDEAKKLIAQIKGGADFAALARQYSTDPGSQQGGDLGFFKRADMLTEFAEAAFALKPGEVSPAPVHTTYGWHVIKVEERRTAPPPTLEQAHDDVRQQLIQENIRAVFEKARTGLLIERFNPDGTPQRATDTAEPPPAPPAR